MLVIVAIAAFIVSCGAAASFVAAGHGGGFRCQDEERTMTKGGKS
jgi:hypothetical protein